MIAQALCGTNLGLGGYELNNASAKYCFSKHSKLIVSPRSENKPGVNLLQIDTKDSGNLALGL